MEDRLRYEIDVPSALRSRALPALTLQPLVGTPSCTASSRRSAAARSASRALERGLLVLTVEDDGAGLGGGVPALPAKAGSHTGTALANIRERLRQAYGDAAELHLRGGRAARRARPPRAARDSTCRPLPAKAGARADAHPPLLAPTRPETTTPTALIADDEPNLASYLQKALARRGRGSRSSPRRATASRHARAHCRAAARLAFLDIKMPGLTGLEVAQGIEGPTRVVFVTAYDEYAVEAFEQQALDYVLKPVKAERLAKTVERLKKLRIESRRGAGRRPPGHGTCGDCWRPPRRQRRCATCARAGRADASDRRRRRALLPAADDKYTCVRTAARPNI